VAWVDAACHATLAPGLLAILIAKTQEQKRQVD